MFRERLGHRVTFVTGGMNGVIWQATGGYTVCTVCPCDQNQALDDEKSWIDCLMTHDFYVHSGLGIYIIDIIYFLFDCFG